ncbi:MAG: tRNA (adenosine(37)-N6)-dimethylallyltransferase MiaA [Firmicutes bacterium]|nr:tRNA (adenosine(37)-N6)-dimethylallyltransferase MiaA [Bacillota bacterium]
MNQIIVIVGPTAMGKTTLSLELAKKLDGEIISADSMQFYKGLDIGTAKIKKEEMEGIKHHLIDILDPSDSFSVAIFQELVREKISLLLSQKKTPIIVGGSGLYLQSVLYQYEFPGVKRSSTEMNCYDCMTNEELMLILTSLNEELAKSVHLSNRRRLLRSIEIAKSLDQDSYQKGKLPFYENVILIGLQTSREKMYQLIEARVDRMVQNGLIEEARSFYDKKISSQCNMAIGYKELYDYFDESVTQDEAIANIKLHSRRYAKRQLTWFKNKMEVNWFEVNLTDFHSTVEEVLQFIEKKV